MTQVPPDSAMPVMAVADELVKRVAEGRRVLLSAPTGSGKSTVVPRLLLERVPELKKGGRIWVTQPRRIAARMLASHVAGGFNEPLGQTVGFWTRDERKRSGRTRIIYITDGLLFRRLLAGEGPAPDDLVIFDEVHERGLWLDFSIAMVHDAQRRGEAGPSWLAMSATMDEDRLAQRMDAVVIRASGRRYPVSIEHATRHDSRPMSTRAAEALERLLRIGLTGDVLIFMPGVREIELTRRSCQAVLARRGLDLSCLPLHGSLGPEAQNAVARPTDPARPRIIVATNIAQTSITIDGLAHVIDSGLARIDVRDVPRGLNRLAVLPISRAAADQRAGRAGRTRAGTCTRLWTEADHARRPENDQPEVHRIDLAEAALAMHAAGVEANSNFPWIDPPDPDALTAANQTLRLLGAIDDQGLTVRGREMARFPLHPRLSRMLMAASERGCRHRASLWAAIVAEGLNPQADPPEAWKIDARVFPASDFRIMERAVRQSASNDPAFRPMAEDRPSGHLVDQHVARRVIRSAQRLETLASNIAQSSPTGHHSTIHHATDTIESVLVKCLMLSFPDHVMLKPDVNRNDLVSGQWPKIRLDRRSVVQREGPVVAIEVGQVEASPEALRSAAGRHHPAAGGRTATRASLVSEIDPAWIHEELGNAIATESATVWDAGARRVVRREVKVLHGLVLEARQYPASASEAAMVMLEVVQRGEVSVPDWDERVEPWLGRVRWLAGLFPERGLPRFDPNEIRVVLLEWIGDATRAGELADRPIIDVFDNCLSWDDRRWLERMAPTRLRLPKGRWMKIEYPPDAQPRGRAKIQDLFGLTQTPRIAGGRQPLVLEILGPHQRPVQITDDLAGFWNGGYHTIRRELRRRYPRHHWPEDPLAADE
ncbi:MAG: ATP-dependent RNA helicase [Phycisphaeraceae bacterium]|nr:ATP-dependent RNA helicase [Phycisphaeraceae bacterium]